jgi:hypothetical protein
VNRTKFAYLVIVFVILSVILFWVAAHLYRQSTAFHFTESSILDSQIFSGTNLNDYHQTEQIRVSRNLDSPSYAAKSYNHTSFKILPKATADNLNALCLWTGNRLAQLDKEIRESGVGSNSQYCEEYDLRRRELVTNRCRDATLKNFQDFC